jgi:hypothetical protein
MINEVLGLGNGYIKLSKEEVNQFVSKSTGIYLLGVKTEINGSIIPVYVGRACGTSCNLRRRINRYLSVLMGKKGKGEVIDYVIENIRNQDLWFVSWKECEPNKARVLEYTILKTTSYKLVNAIGMGKGSKKRAWDYACSLIEEYEKKELIFQS